MAIAQDSSTTRESEQSELNQSFDTTNRLLMVESVESDGAVMKLPQSKLVAIKITVAGAITYVAKAPVGTAQASAAWQAKKIETAGADTTITWAETAGTANPNYVHVATDLTALSYS